MSQLEFIPLANHSTSEAREVGADIYGLLQKSEVVKSLRARNLLGLVARHTVSPERSADSMESLLNPQKQKMLQAFVIRAAGTETTVGMATIQHDLQLHKQRLPLSAKITRRLRPLLSAHVEVEGANVSAWTDYTRVDGSGLYTDIHESYKFLKGKAPESWTLVSNAQDPNINTFIDAVYKAGFLPDVSTCWTRLDEGENTWTPAPLGIVLATRPAYTKAAY